LVYSGVDYIRIACALIVISDAVIAAVLLGTFVLLVIITQRKALFTAVGLKLKVILLIFGIIFAVEFFRVFLTVDVDPVYKQANAWDISQYLQQVKTIGLPRLLAGFGLQLWLFLYGIILVFKKEHISAAETCALLVTGLGLFGYIVPLIFQIHVLGFRFIFSATYIFASCLALYAIDDLSRRIKLKNSFLLIMAVYMGVNLISFFRTWLDYAKIPPEPDYHFTYLPKDLFEGMKFLRTAEPLDGNVLASPKTSIDLMIPGLAGRYTYSGHFLTTYNSQIKDANANNFFYKWTDRPGTHTFLKANNIRFIVVTRYSGAKEAMKTYYPFLKVVFENPTVTIFRYDPQDES
jgi:hypothetical protein